MATISKLPDSTIRLIAAGEVITRPVNVVKELLENSLDAGSTCIRMSIEQGGVTSIEINDDGHGIARVNAELLCRRHTTSKLNVADDLTRISTFGFRGEALASISEMADLEVETFNIKCDKQGWQADYKNGELVGKTRDKYKSNPGTRLRISNLFAQTHHRKEAIKTSHQEEKKAIVELVKRYAIHHRDKLTISLKESFSTDIICLIAPMDMKSCIGMFFGLEMADNVIEFTARDDKIYKSEAHIVFTYKKSTTTTSVNNLIFILFVNNRLVECLDLKREIDAQIPDHLNCKHFTPLVYIALKVPTCDVDVNTHPSKATVSLHYQQEIIALIVSTMKAKLREELLNQKISTNTTHQKAVDRSLMIIPESQSTIDSLSSQGSQRLKLLVPGFYSSNQSSPVSGIPAKRPHDMVHTDPSQTTLKQLSSVEKRIRWDVKHTSIIDLKEMVRKEQTKDLWCIKAIKNSTFVGLFDHEWALIQHDTKLYALNFKAYLKELYYQFYLFDFGNFPPIEILPPGNKIKHLIEIYFEDIRTHDINQFKRLKFNESQSVVDKLLKHSAIFEDYLSLKMTQEEILTLPCIMPYEAPNLAYLGKLFVQLANNVDFTEERSCLRHIGRIMADVYSEPPLNLKDETVSKRYHDLVETKLYRAIKNYLIPPEWLFVKENICQISDTKDLYKVFERC